MGCNGYLIKKLPGALAILCRLVHTLAPLLQTGENMTKPKSRMETITEEDAELRLHQNYMMGSKEATILLIVSPHHHAS